MKKITNILLFSGLAVILVLMILGFSSLFSETGTAMQYDDNDESYVAEKVEKRDLEIFDAIENEGVCEIVLEQSYRSAAEISASDYVAKCITTKVEDGVLKISTLPIDNKNFKNKVTIYSPTCSAIKNDGVGSITCDSLSTGRLKVDNEGIGNITINNLTATRLKVENEGVGNITLSGVADSAKLENEGIGKIDALNLESFTYGGTSVRIAGGKAGPVKVEADTPAVFFARFTNKEKMKLSLHLTEVVNK